MNINSLRAAIGSALLLASVAAFALASPAQVDQAMKSGDYASARTMLTEITAAKPESAKGWFMLAQAEAKLGHKSEATTAFRKAESLDPTHKNIAGGDYAQVAQFVKTADTSAIPTPKQVEEAIRTGNYKQAESMLKEILTAKPDSAKAWYWMAQTEEKMGKPAQAKQALNKAEKLDPSLKFASPGAVQNMHARLGDSQSVAQNNGQDGSIYKDRPAVGSSANGSKSATGTAISPSKATTPAVPEQTGGHGWIYALGMVIVVFGGVGYWLTKRAKAKALEDQERDRKALLARANSIQERATALVKTARFEDQESSAFGVESASTLSKANSALSRLKVSFAKIDTIAERRELEEMESDVESLEGQANRKAWNEQAPKLANAPAESNVAAFAPAGYAQSQQPQSRIAPPPQASGFGGGHPPQASGFGGYAQGPGTVVVNQGSSGHGLLETMIIADAIRGNQNHSHHSDREYDLERQLERERSRNSSSYVAPVQTYEQPAPAPAAFDLGSGSDSSWDSGSSSPSSSDSSWDSGSSSSSSDSSWDSSSSSSSSSDSSSSSSDSSSSSSDSSW